MGLRDIAAKVAASKASGSGNWIKPGRGVLMVKDLRYDSAGFKGDKFIAELRVIESQSMAGRVDKEGKAVLANEAGTTVSFVQLFDQQKEVAFPNTKGFILALFGEKEDEISAEEFVGSFEVACNKTQPARGMLIKYETVDKTTKKQNEIVVPKWEHVPGQTEATIAKNRAWLDGVEKAEQKPEEKK
jgi:hypothetical protein